MSDWLISQIRTYVPAGVGALLAWLATLGLDLGAEAQVGLVTFLTAALTGVYYTLIRLLERRWPQVGILLGARKTPVYEAK